MNEELRRRVARTYMAAEEAQHAQRDGRVEIHVGERVLEDLRAELTTPAEGRLYGQRATFFGWPVLTPDYLDGDAIEVVTTVRIA